MKSNSDFSIENIFSVSGIYRLFFISIFLLCFSFLFGWISTLLLDVEESVMGVTTSTPVDNSVAKGVFFFVLKNYTVPEGGIFCRPFKD
jgi:hypothetical protein